jgi:uncharacterized protein (TIGR00266 family)
MATSHEIEYQVHGAEMQFVEVVLDPGETVFAEAGAMLYMDQGIQMATHLGDKSEKHSGVMGTLLGAGKRAITGEKLWMTHFTNQGKGKLRVAFSSPYPGTIVPIDLKQFGQQILCQKGAFLCAARGTSISMAFTKRFTAGLWGGEGFVLQKLEGNGMSFVHAGGKVIDTVLKPGETIYVETGALVALESTVSYEIEVIKGIKSMLFGGEGLFLTRLKGPGRVWLQSFQYGRFLGTVAYTVAGILNPKG